jgi:hypothetical protein
MYIIYYNGIINNCRVARRLYVIVINICSSKIPVSYKAPPIIRNLVAIAIGHIDTDARFDRSPSIITFRSSPGNPSRPPLITWHPYRPVYGIGIPTTVMKRRPSPGIIRDPCPSGIGKYPIPIGTIRSKPRIYIRHPNISIIRIIYPFTVGTQIVIKDLEINGHLHLRGQFLWCYPNN